VDCQGKVNIITTRCLGGGCAVASAPHMNWRTFAVGACLASCSRPSRTSRCNGLSEPGSSTRLWRSSPAPSSAPTHRLSMEPTPRKTTGDLRPASQVFGFGAILPLASRAVEDPAPPVWAGVLV